MRRQEVQTHIHPRVPFLSERVHPVCVCLCLEVAEVLVVDVVHDGVDAAGDFQVVAIAGGVLLCVCVCVCVYVCVLVTYEPLPLYLPFSLYIYVCMCL